MPSNIEIKAKVENLDRTRSLVRQLTTDPCQELIQQDIFFTCATGRLKLRILSENSAELISYTRPDTPGAKQSDYRIYRTSNPQSVREVLAHALGETVIVKKRRELYLVGQTRIHLDEVEGLGDFIELEVVLGPGDTPQYGHEIARGLMKQLDIHSSNLISCAYADLLLQKTKDNENH
jgi:predicted adenylyl cyclase CyaB